MEVCEGVGRALGKAGRPLVYGGGRKGIMGVVSGAVLEAGGSVTGVLPAAMIASGGEHEAVKTPAERKAAAEALCDGRNRENVGYMRPPPLFFHTHSFWVIAFAGDDGGRRLDA